MSTVTTPTAFTFLKPRELHAAAGKFLVATKLPHASASAETEKRYADDQKPSVEKARQFAQEVIADHDGMQACIFDQDGHVVEWVS